MHILQKQLIEDFQKKYHGISFTEASRVSKIERTRLFRIFNGQDMKLSEWDKLSNIVYDEKDKNRIFPIVADIGKSKDDIIASIKRLAFLKELKYQVVY